ncbi:hypothetical protein BN7_3858 [Wickerhamomyces ciferrii]|uniref:Uncharacterized protein n=1 Tax=Wickerhamomyces ciferrii (strain ATCC 14091 / BCRC 22168 / CBS 111 / JCM 3599 / NBRC 0793 / NRRL Y-1031 F-60-10) TaxID=1206466 RepID=K0KMX6_WICCF|nr:uncharacterized protein BN7_3858 [Wickerhamomyces ciferrii]CCH44296.1 hypothetical protein BN7_3858 [Wickerhamomyces ciferrii]
MVRLSDLPDHCLQEIFIDHLDYGFENLKALYRIDKQFGGLLKNSIAIVTNDINLPNHEMTLVDGLDDLDLRIVEKADSRFKYYFVNYNLEMGYDLKIFEQFNEVLKRKFKVNFFTPNCHIKNSFLSGVSLMHHEIEKYDKATGLYAINENKVNRGIFSSADDVYLLGMNEYFIGSPVSNNLEEELKLRNMEPKANSRGNYLSKSEIVKKSFKKYIKRLRITNYDAHLTSATFQVNNLHLLNLEELYLNSAPVVEDELCVIREDSFSIYEDNSKQEAFKQYGLYSISYCDFPSLQKLRTTNYTKIESFKNVKCNSLKELEIRNNILLNIENCEFSSLTMLKISLVFQSYKKLFENKKVQFDEEINGFCNRYSVPSHNIKYLNFLRIINTDFKKLECLVVPNLRTLSYFNRKRLPRLLSVEVQDEPNINYKVAVFTTFPGGIFHKNNLPYTAFRKTNVVGSEHWAQDFFYDFNSIFLVENKNKVMNLFIPVTKDEIFQGRSLPQNENFVGITTSTSAAFVPQQPIVRCQTSYGDMNETNVYYYCLLDR